MIDWMGYTGSPRPWLDYAATLGIETAFGESMLPIRILTATTFGAALLLSAAQSASVTETPLEIAVATGTHLFATATFGGNGRTCESCHQDGGKAPGQLGDRKLPSLLNAAAIYPRFSRSAGRVVTLEGQVQS